MPVEIRIAAFGAVLLLIHIVIATQLKNNQYGVKWNMGARDDNVSPPAPATGRMVRAQVNFLETFPIAIIALLGVVILEGQVPPLHSGGGSGLAPASSTSRCIGRACRCSGQSAGASASWGCS